MGVINISWLLLPSLSLAVSLAVGWLLFVLLGLLLVEVIMVFFWWWNAVRNLAISFSIMIRLTSG